jgi:hypothetical protein
MDLPLPLNHRPAGFDGAPFLLGSGAGLACFDEPRVSRGERLREFLRRLGAAPAFPCAESAFEGVRTTLNAVENELSGIPYDPCHPRGDGRLYPAKRSWRSRVPGRPDLRRYRFKAHRLYIGASGAILIEHRDLGVAFRKAGQDGSHVELAAGAGPGRRTAAL